MVALGGSVSFVKTKQSIVLNGKDSPLFNPSSPPTKPKERTELDLRR